MNRLSPLRLAVAALLVAAPLTSLAQSQPQQQASQKGQQAAQKKAPGKGATPTVVPKKGGGESAGVTPVQAMALASQLAQWARQSENAAALAVAAQMIEAAAPRKLEVKEPKSTGKGSADKGGKTAQPLDPKGLLEEAKRLAGDDAKQQAALDAIAKRGGKARGGFTGPGMHCSVVGPQSTDSFLLFFNANEPAEISLMGDGDSDLDLFVYDVSGKAISEDARPNDFAYAVWTPAMAAPFRVEVRNLGERANQYCAYSN